MLNESWYPTPEALANKIRRMIDWKEVKSIADTSAGRGDLLIHVLGSITTEGTYGLPKDAVKVKIDKKVENIYAIEIDPSLRGALSKVKFCEYYNNDPQSIKIIGSDFLNYNGFYNIDCIVMNPPFDRGADHLLKAIEIMRKGQLICILNKDLFLVNSYVQKTLLVLL